MATYKYTYTGSGIMTFHDKKGTPHIVTTENREVILTEKLNIAGLKREEIRKAKNKKEVKE